MAEETGGGDYIILISGGPTTACHAAMRREEISHIPEIGTLLYLGFLAHL